MLGFFHVWRWGLVGRRYPEGIFEAKREKSFANAATFKISSFLRGMHLPPVLSLLFFCFDFMFGNPLFKFISLKNDFPTDF